MADKNVQMPDGTIVAFPDSMSDDQIASVLKSQHPAAAPDSRNAAQKVFDRLVTVTPEDQQGHSALFNQAQKFGAGAIQGFGSPIVHPLDTISGIGTAIAHPLDTARAMYEGARENPAQAAGNLVGGAVLGEGMATGTNAVNAVASKAAGRAALLGKTPEAAYESALKPAPSASIADRASAVRAGLQNSIPVSRAGLDKLWDSVEALDNTLTNDVIGKDPHRPISGTPNNLQRFSARRDQFSNQVTPASDLNAFDAAKQEFMASRGAKPSTPPQATGLLDANGKPIMSQGTPATPPQPMTAVDAQAIKRGTYQVLKGKYGEQGSAAVEAQKALASDINAEISRQFPEAAGINKEMGGLLDLQPFLERAVNRAGNQGLFRLGTAAVAGTAKALGAPEKMAAVAAVMKQVLDDPMVKSRLAIALSRGGKIPYAQAVARVGAYSAALGSTSQAPQESNYGGNPTQLANGQP